MHFVRRMVRGASDSWPRRNTETYAGMVRRRKKMRIRQKTVIEQMDAADRIKATDAELCRKEIERLGWVPEEDYSFSNGTQYRAVQNGFGTAWLESWQAVLNYIQAKGKK